MPEEANKDEREVQEGEGSSRGRRLRGARVRNAKLTSKQAVFEKLRQARSENKKHKVEVGPVDSLFDYVEPDAYAEIVQKRQEANFVVRGENDGPDDDYYDDGQELFDEEYDDEPRTSAGKKGQGKKTKGRPGDKEDEEEKRPGVRVVGDIRNFMLASNAAKSKPKDNALSQRNEVILEHLLEELTGVADEPPPAEPSRLQMIFPTSKLSAKRPAFNSDRTPSTSKFPVDDIFFDSPVVENFAVEPVVVKSATPRFVESPTADKGTKRALAESPRKAEPPAAQPSSGPVRTSVLIAKMTPITMDRPRAAANTAKADTVKKTKPNTPKKSLNADDWDDDGWEPDADFENSVRTAENLADQMSSMDTANTTSRMPVITTKFGDISAKSANKSADSMIALSDAELVALASGDDGGLKFYCLDVYEDSNQPGCVFLFGKILGESKNFVSTCIKVTNIDRKLYFCLREKRYDLHEENDTDEPVDYDAVKGELVRLKQNYKLPTYRFAEGVKKYCFSKVDIPDEVKVLEVRYPFTSEALPDNLAGETFSHVFGRNTTAMEIFLLDRKLKGPCWLNIAKAAVPKSPISWCQREYVVEKPIHVSVIQNMSLPHVTVMAIHLRVVVDSRTKQNEIVGAGVLWHKEFPLDKAVNKENVYTDHLMLVSHPSGTVFPMGIQNDMQRTSDLIKKEFRMDTKIVGNERHLLSELFTLIQRVDPDFLIFHDGLGYQLEVLLHRADQLKVPNWNRLGRLQRKVMPKGRHAVQIASSGRLVCDVRRSAEELIHLKSYDLSELVSEILKQDRQDVDSDIIKAMYRTSHKLVDLISLTLLDANYVLQIMAELDAIPLAREITSIAGNSMSRTLLGGRSERNEFLLLHAFTNGGFICPDKEYRDFHKKGHKSGNNKTKVQEETRDETENGVVFLEDDNVENETGQPQLPSATGKRKPAYTGGLVLDPKKGLHDSFILLMDFNSLYPSIIQEYNICFTTVDRSCLADVQEDKIPDIPSNSEQGILPAEIYRLVDARRSVKKLIKEETNPEKLKQYDIRQKALKLTANSMYGCLGFANSRFFARPLAALITSQGREILKSTKDLVEKMGLEVIYGDTDSIMINTRLQEYTDVVQRGNEIRSKVGRLYKCLDLGIDGVFRKLLLLQKKKYAALVVKKENGHLTYQPEVKGLDIVRRDWSILARDAGRYVVEEILRVQPPEVMIEKIQSKLREISAAVNEVKSTEIHPFVITKQLTKDPTKYADVKSQPHVQVALRWNKASKNAKQMMAGDVVPFVICNEAPPNTVGSGNNQRVPHTQRAYHVEEVLQSNGSLTIDKQYYLAEQVHKVVNRVCEFVDGLDSAIIAECLGVDRTLFPHQYMSAPAEDTAASGAVPDSELYLDCQPLIITCSHCSERWEFGSPVWEKDGKYWLSLQKCPACDEVPLNHYWQIRNTLHVEIGKAIQRYYKVQFTCEDVACQFICSFIPPKFHRGRPVCPSCNKSLLKVDFSERDLYLQLCYWKNAFDPVKAIGKIKNKSVKDELTTALGTFANGEMDAVYAHLALFVKTFIDKSAYGEVKFADFFPKPMEKHDVKTEIKEED